MSIYLNSKSTEAVGDVATPVSNGGPPGNSTYPVIDGLAVLRWAFEFVGDPLIATQRMYSTFGPIAALGSPLPFLKNRKPFLLAVGAEFNRAALSNPETWRPWHIVMRGPKNSAQRRQGLGIVRMTGRRHEHYRRLLMPPLRKASVDELGEQMTQLAGQEVSSWPVGKPFDLWRQVRRLMRTFAIGLLFGDDRKHGYPIADLIGRQLEANWSPAVLACPINLPFTPYGQLKRRADALDPLILDWAKCKHGHLDGRDLLSIVVNNPDEDGSPPTDAIISGHLPTLFGAAYETCQNVLIWTLILIAQHPQVASDLLEEARTRLGSARASLDAIAELRLLDAVIKESMRLLPPVPMQIREARQEASLAGRLVPKGARVVLSSFLTNRNPDLYSEPDCFRPERWATINPSAFEYSAFSAGPRSCPGYRFGLSAVKVALLEILGRYRVTLTPGVRIDYKVRIALSPGGPVLAVLHRQDGMFAAAPVRGAINRLVRFPER
jgi:cytochrome P450